MTDETPPSRAGKQRDHSNEQTNRVDLSVLSPEEREALAALLRKAMGAVTDDTPLLREILQEVDAELQAKKVAALCKMQTGRALARGCAPAPDGWSLVAIEIQNARLPMLRCAR